MRKLQKSYFLQKDILAITRSLLGKYVFTFKDGQVAGGIISEVEAYHGTSDRASHAYGGRRTKRNEMMYHEGGVIYMFLCYGVHAMLNFVTNDRDIPDAILVRGIIPTHGTELMLQRTGKTHLTHNLCNGPGKVCKALGLSVSDNGHSLESSEIWLEDRGLIIPDAKIDITPRIGVDYAGDDKLLPYRFLIQNEFINTIV